MHLGRGLRRGGRVRGSMRVRGGEGLGLESGFGFGLGFGGHCT